MLSRTVDLADDRVEEAASVLRKRIRPIVIPTAASKPDSIGSSVLLRVGGRTFCVTAAHVLDEVRKAGEGAVMLPNGRIIHIEGPFHTSSIDGDRVDDRIDVGVVDLGTKGSQLDADHVLSPEDLALEERNAPRGTYLLMGYPVSRNGMKRDRFGNEKFGEILSKFYGTEPSEEVSSSLGYPRSSHVVVDVDRRKSERDKKQPDGPHVRGLSGAPLWRLPPLTDRITEDLRPKMVAVFTENPDMVGAHLVCTRVAMVTELLRAAVPELRSTLPMSRTLRVRVHTHEIARDRPRMLTSDQE